MELENEKLRVKLYNKSQKKKDKWITSEAWLMTSEEILDLLAKSKWSAVMKLVFKEAKPIFQRHAQNIVNHYKGLVMEEKAQEKAVEQAEKDKKKAAETEGKERERIRKAKERVEKQAEKARQLAETRAEKAAERVEKAAEKAAEKKQWAIAKAAKVAAVKEQQEAARKAKAARGAHGRGKKPVRVVNSDEELSQVEESSASGDEDLGEDDGVSDVDSDEHGSGHTSATSRSDVPQAAPAPTQTWPIPRPKPWLIHGVAASEDVGDVGKIVDDPQHKEDSTGERSQVAERLLVSEDSLLEGPAAPAGHYSLRNHR